MVWWQTYRLYVKGLVEDERAFSWSEILAMTKSSVNVRLTSVTGFSVRAVWEGVLWHDFVKSVTPQPVATHATFANVSYTYETTVSMEK